VLATLAFITFAWVLLPVRGQGISMEPTYRSGTLHLINRLAYTSHGPARGDVVAIRMPTSRVVYVKRVIGLPGERVAIVKGRVLVDGRGIDEPYVRSQRPWNLEPVTLSPHQYFVIGDNRGMNLEDHSLGPVEASRIIGRVIF
jgi:signal peptidase I